MLVAKVTMGGGNDGGSSDEEEEEDGEHGVDSADERSKVRGWLSDMFEYEKLRLATVRLCSSSSVVRGQPLCGSRERRMCGCTFVVLFLMLLLI